MLQQNLRVKLSPAEVRTLTGLMQDPVGRDITRGGRAHLPRQSGNEVLWNMIEGGRRGLKIHS